MYDMVYIKYRYFPITVQIALIDGFSAYMAVVNSLKIFLFKQRRYQVVVLSFIRKFLPEEFIQSFRAF